jgi:23S rRNA (uracil1939-C5)-methyltransferase
VSVEKGDCVEVEVVDFGSRGEGVCKYKDFTIFVEGVVPGDILETEVFLKKRNYAKGNIKKMIKLSEKRQDAPCEYFNECGGCQIQNVKYEEQLKYKKEKVYSALTRIGKIDDFVLKDVIGMEEPYRYRNKGQFPIQLNNKTVEIGFYKFGSHDVVDLDQCIIQEKISDDVIQVVRSIANDNKISIYNENKHRGVLRHVIVRTAYKTKDTMVIIVTNGYELPFKNTFIEKLQEIPEIKSCIQNINTQKGNRIMGSKNRTLFGERVITDYIDDLVFEISPLSFFQINSVQTEKLYRKVLEYAGLTGEETVFDLYCGIGSISLFLAKKAKKVYGVEIVEQAIKDANENAKRNNIKNVEFIHGKSEVVLPQMNKDGIKADVIVVDPPRKGCDERLLETIVEMMPEKIVYVSCKPSTLARDLKLITEKGYSVDKVQPVDMFPHSTHVETVVLMSRVKK